MTTIKTEFDTSETAYGLPRRINRNEFELRSVLSAYSIGNNFVGEKKQEDYYKIACRKDSGWTMFINCSADIETGRIIAANIASSYLERGMRIVWQNLGNNENIKTINDHVSLLVIDTLYDDSPSYRRDRVYDLISYVHDRPNTSILLISKSRHPEYMSKFLGLRPNFALLVEK